MDQFNQFSTFDNKINGLCQVGVDGWRLLHQGWWMVERDSATSGVECQKVCALNHVISDVISSITIGVINDECWFK